MIHWEESQYLYLLWLMIPLTVMMSVLLRRRESRIRKLILHGDELSSTRAGEPDSISSLLPDRIAGQARRRMFVYLVAITLTLMAMARPQWGEVTEEIPHHGLELITVLDVSNSMRAEDFRPSRLERARLELRNLTGRLKGDRIGLIVFEGTSVMECPPTVDYAGFKMILDDVFAGMTPRGGTAIEQALRFAAGQFDDERSSDRIILLITDGEDHEGDPLATVDELREKNIRVFAVGVGTPEGDVIPVSDEHGETTYLRDREGNLVLTRLHEESIEQLAMQTGGMYVRAVPENFGLDRIFEEGIRPLQRAELETITITRHQDRHYWFIAAALLLLCVEAILPEKRKSRST